MSLHTATPKNADQLMARLRDTEIIKIRGCTPAGLEHMRQNDLYNDRISAEDMQKVYARCVARISDPAYNNFPV